jgi:hypothetical chaperone protein
MKHRIIPHFGANVMYRVPFGSNVLKMPTSLMDKLCSPPDIQLLRKRDTMEFFKNVQSWSLKKADQQKMDNLFSLLENQLGFSVFEEIEGTKRRLSGAAETDFHFSYPGMDLKERVTRPEFDGYVRDRVEAILTTLDGTLSQGQVSADEVDVVVCTGGTAQVPVIYEGLARRFGADKIEHHNSFHGVVEGLRERARELAAQS